MDCKLRVRIPIWGMHLHSNGSMDGTQGWDHGGEQRGGQASDAAHRLRGPDFDVSLEDSLNEEGSRNFSAGAPSVEPVTVISTAATGLTAA